MFVFGLSISVGIDQVMTNFYLQRIFEHKLLRKLNFQKPGVFTALWEPFSNLQHFSHDKNQNFILVSD
jgi:hypothetical protein